MKKVWILHFNTDTGRKWTNYFDEQKALQRKAIMECEDKMIEQRIIQKNIVWKPTLQVCEVSE